MDSKNHSLPGRSPHNPAWQWIYRRLDHRLLARGIRYSLLALGMTTIMGCTVLQSISKNVLPPTAAPR